MSIDISDWDHGFLFTISVDMSRGRVLEVDLVLSSLCLGDTCRILCSRLYFLINSCRSSSFCLTRSLLFILCLLSAFLSLKKSLILNFSRSMGSLKPDRAPGCLMGIWLWPLLPVLTSLNELVMILFRSISCEFV